MKTTYAYTVSTGHTFTAKREALAFARQYVRECAIGETVKVFAQPYQGTAPDARPVGPKGVIWACTATAPRAR